MYFLVEKIFPIKKEMNKSSNILKTFHHYNLLLQFD